MAAASTQVPDPVAAGVLTFDERTVPCTPEALEGVRRILLVHSDSRRPEDVAVLRAIADPLHGMGADDAHRQLLVARRSVARTAPWLVSDVGAALKSVRRHSRLYTRRDCPCLFAAWRVFVADVGRLLTGSDGMWAVSTAGQPQRDVTGPLRGTDLGRCSSTGLWERPVRTPVRVALSSAAGPRIDVIAGRQVTTLTLLTSRQSRAAHLVRWAGQTATAAAGSWVLSWPAELIDVIFAFAGNPGRSAALSDDAAGMLAAGFADLPADVRVIAARLAVGWTAPAASLVTAATGVARTAA